MRAVGELPMSPTLALRATVQRPPHRYQEQSWCCGRPLHQPRRPHAHPRRGGAARQGHGTTPSLRSRVADQTSHVVRKKTTRPSG